SDLRTAAGRWRVEGIASERLAPEDLLRVEPALSPTLLGGYFLPDRAQIRNPRPLKAPKAALRHPGGAILPAPALVGLERDGRRIGGLKTTTGVLPCGQVVVAAGAWSGGLLVGFGARVATPPLKGQIVMLRGDRIRLRRIIEHGKNYLVPREDGRILI